MFAWPTGCVVLLISLTGAMKVENKGPTPKVGDIVVVNLTDEFAKEYAIRANRSKEIAEAKGLSISIPATVAQRLADGKYRIESSAPIKLEGSKPQMITLSAVVEPARFTSEVTPKNTPVYASPGDVKKNVAPRLTKEDLTTLHLELSNLREGKLQLWALVDEVGND